MRTFFSDDFLFTVIMQKVSNMESNPLFEMIDRIAPEMYETLKSVVRIPALAPENEGDGELEKANYLVELLERFGFEDIRVVKAPDERVSCGYRPNVIALLKGTEPESGTIWSAAHTDVVPPGDMGLWDTEPFEPVETDERIIGRGVEDNTQSMIASLFAARVVKESGMWHRHNIGLAFMADEEVGSKYGIKYVIENTDLFEKKDIVVVPDSGNPEGDFIEVSEKSILWLRVTTTGKQCHASSPERGNNAYRAAMKFLLRADELLHERYADVNPLFDPPTCTFEPTKKLANVGNVNTIPGEDVSYFDMRILPRYDPEDALRDLEAVAREVEAETGVTITFQRENYDRAAPPTPADAPVVERLSKAIKKVYDVKPKAGGIGGGTCAAIFRRAGYNAAVWSTIEEQAHAPNEYILKKNLVGDCKVFAALFTME